jgi:hypothetical protein
MQIYYNFFILPFTEGHLVWFHILGIMNSAAVNMGVQVSFWYKYFIFFGNIPNSGIKILWFFFFFFFEKLDCLILLMKGLLYLKVEDTDFS